jgi:hypothetical protein
MKNNNDSSKEVIEITSNNYEAKKNLEEFFNLLLKIDRRLNPHLYKNTPRRS